ncbi:DUF6069 family protein [Krasilnikoviella flava]|uniref:Uncharacterized protein n=1 Tax=Krasilnikoviella flava TaxID=526729 RepID=A0A1T5KPR7_9MICO|nr:hypothetical protein [Krasilnikoviella flava]SKC65660.1 hypothetical protein SAMN04324258_2242 [Krasilnikoviella flava]
MTDPRPTGPTWPTEPAGPPPGISPGISPGAGHVTHPVPTAEPVDAWDAPPPTSRGLLALDRRRYWSGAAVTVVVCAVLGLAASVVFDSAFDVGLLGPSRLVPGAPALAWALTGAVFALLAAVVLQLLVRVVPRPRMFFGWLVALVTVILAALAFTGTGDAASAVVTALVWVVVGVAVSAMLNGVLGRTLVRPARPTR